MWWDGLIVGTSPKLTGDFIPGWTVLQATAGLTRDDLGSGHSRSFWNLDLRDLSVILSLRGKQMTEGLTRVSQGHSPSNSTCCVAHSSSEVQADWRSVTWMFTSNKVGTSSNLLCRGLHAHLSKRSLRTWVGTSSNLGAALAASSLRAKVHFEHELGLHPTQVQHLPQAHFELMFTSNISWDFIQLRCSTCCRLTRAYVHFEQALGLHPTMNAALAACSLEPLRFGLAVGTQTPVPGIMYKLKGTRNADFGSLRTELGLHPTNLQYLLHAHSSYWGPDRWVAELHPPLVI